HASLAGIGSTRYAQFEASIFKILRGLFKLTALHHPGIQLLSRYCTAATTIGIARPVDILSCNLRHGLTTGHFGYLILRGHTQYEPLLQLVNVAIHEGIGIDALHCQHGLLDGNPIRADIFAIGTLTGLLAEPHSDRP